MALALLLGAGTGLGIVSLLFGLWPARPTLAQELHRLRHGTPVRPADPGAGLLARLGRPLAGPLAAWGLPGVAARRDLAVCGGSTNGLLGEKAVVGIAGALLGPAACAAAAFADAPTPWQVSAGTSALLGTAGFLAPDRVLRSRAARRRDELRHALSAFLDLAVIALAEDRDIDGALTEAARAGDGWAFERLGAAVRAALTSGRPPWAALGRMGEEYGVHELAGLAVAGGLAGADATRLRASLTARAAELRSRRLAETEIAARAATERMDLPVTGLLLGFLIFTGYPAVASVLAGL
ncbi:type II secretion system F family protein [Planomonospora sp. ID91781]|uniref:type II secretion system F family protein n=1 Tax=Planomonospora sp. ID91781 TaxID=2738135 RepID=UPI0018C36214|nr:type II secretion system F family protein [Planomonospora sp. ID91781]MBG0819369.1 type II secretion system F family protein [Planomonospora sp. ID91781]